MCPSLNFSGGTEEIFREKKECNGFQEDANVVELSNVRKECVELDDYDYDNDSGNTDHEHFELNYVHNFYSTSVSPCDFVCNNDKFDRPLPNLDSHCADRIPSEAHKVHGDCDGDFVDFSLHDNFVCNDFVLDNKSMHQLHGTESGEDFVCHNVKTDQRSSNRPLYNFSSHLANNVSSRSCNKVASHFENFSLNNNVHDSFNVNIDGEDIGHNKVFVNNDYDCESDGDENSFTDLTCIDYDYDNVTSKCMPRLCDGKEYYDNVNVSSKTKEYDTLNGHSNIDSGNISNNLSVLYFNARSIKNKIAEFQARVNVEKPHIIAITESWLDDSFNDGEVFPSDYSVFRNDRNRRGGGVALGILTVLNPVLKSDFLSSGLEIVWAEFDSVQGKNLFGVYYRPPSQYINGLDILDDNLSKIQALGRFYNLCTLVGDFNIHIDWVNEHINIKGSLPKSLLDTMQSSGFTQVLKDPTYKTLNGIDHFLDLVFVSNPSCVLSCNSTYNLNGCDHSAVEVLLNMSPLKEKAVKKSVYCLNKADFNQMKCMFVNFPWNLCFDNDIDIMWDKVESFLKSSIDHSVPKKFVKKNNNLPWMNKEIRKLCTKKKMLYKRAKASKSAVAQQQFKDCSNKLKALIRKSHSSYTYSISKNFKSNPKKFWSYIASTKKCSDNLSFTIDDVIVNDSMDIANAFNKHFSSKFDGMYDPLDLALLIDSPTSHGGSSFSFDPFTVNEVFEVLKNLDSSKSPGPDELLPVFLKVCCNELAPVMCDIFNVFVQKGGSSCRLERC